MEDLERYLRDYVMPVIAEFEEKPASVRHAFVACVVTFHSVDYLAHPKPPATLRQEWKRTNAFAIVDDVAHAFKHVVSGNKSNPKLRAKELVAQSSVFDEATFDGGAFDLGAVTLHDPSVNILETVKAAAEFISRQETIA